MDQIALQNKTPATIVAKASTPTQVVVSTSIVHRF
jgi:hypothetical protein